MARAQIIDPNDDEYALAPAATPEGGSAADDAPLDASAEDMLLGDDVPEQYRGKKARDLLGVVQNQHSMIGRQSQEVHTLREEARRLREMVDKSIMRGLPGGDDPSAGSKTALTKNDFWDRPEEVVPTVVKDALSPHTARLEQLEYNQRRTEFNSTYKSAAQDLNDPAFVGYVEKSARRQRLAQRAFKDLEHIDFDAAEELWESYAEFRELTAAATQESAPPADKKEPNPPARRKQTPPPAMRGSGGGDPDNTTAATGKVWQETELLRMQETDPDAYWALAASGEIDRAWKEKRVRRQG